MPYCIYTDTDVPLTRGNLDHIVPLSLGGCDDFRIWASKAFNSDMGSQIDGRIANDPFVMLARHEADARGHSGRAPVPGWKRSTLDGKPVQLSLAKEELSAWDPIARRRMPEAELAGQSFATRLQIDFGAPLKFVTKLALAGAYFIYGETFSASFDCGQLTMMSAMSSCSVPGRWSA